MPLRGKNRQKNQEQHFRQRIIHFAGLTMIWQSTEIVEKTCRLRNLCKSGPAAIHHRPPPATQWMKQIQHFRPLSRKSLHPIALGGRWPALYLLEMRVQNGHFGWRILNRIGRLRASQWQLVLI